MLRTNFNNILPEILVLIVLSFFVFSSCSKPKREPKVITGEITDITINSARASGNIIDVGDGITDHGHCWSLSPGATVSNFKTVHGTISRTGSYPSIVQNLQPGTKYYIKAYVKNEDGEFYYGGESSFTTTSGGQTGTLTDIDGNVYNTVTTGTQTWMAGNLKTTRYRDGAAIPNVTDASEWAALTTGAYCDYDNTPGNSTTYGKLYNYYTVVDPRNLCPTGWHVPSDAEWTTLTTYLGGENVAGGKLKSTTLWNSPNTGATNETGFSALPGGYRYGSGTFVSIGYLGPWWSSTQYSSTYAWYRSMSYLYSNVCRYYFNKQYGFSVRCVRD